MTTLHHLSSTSFTRRAASQTWKRRASFCVLLTAFILHTVLVSHGQNVPGSLDDGPAPPAGGPPAHRCATNFLYDTGNGLNGSVISQACAQALGLGTVNAAGTFTAPAGTASIQPNNGAYDLWCFPNINVSATDSNKNVCTVRQTVYVAKNRTGGNGAIAGTSILNAGWINETKACASGAGSKLKAFWGAGWQAPKVQFFAQPMFDPASSQEKQTLKTFLSSDSGRQEVAFVHSTLSRDTFIPQSVAEQLELEIIGEIDLAVQQPFSLIALNLAGLNQTHQTTFPVALLPQIDFGSGPALTGQVLINSDENSALGLLGSNFLDENFVYANGAGPDGLDMYRHEGPNGGGVPFLPLLQPMVPSGVADLLELDQTLFDSGTNTLAFDLLTPFPNRPLVLERSMNLLDWEPLAIVSPQGAGTHVMQEFLEDSSRVMYQTRYLNPDDIDGDGLSDADESNIHGTKPLVADTDGDGFTDGEEVAKGSGPLDPFSTPEIALHLPMGANLFQSSGQLTVPIPADFFHPGSQPFANTIPLQGLPLGTRGAFELGTTDTVVERWDSTSLPLSPSQAEVPISIVELSLKSVDPITVMVDGEAQQWNVSVSLDSEPAEDRGVLDLRRTGQDQGEFDMNVPVRVRLQFVRDSEVRELLLPEMDLIGESGQWLPMLECPSAALEVPRLPIDLCLGIELVSPQFTLILSPPFLDPERPAAMVSGGAEVAENVGSLARHAVISEGASVGPDSVIGPNAFISADAVVGENVLIGANVMIGAGAQIGNGAIIDDGSQVGVNVQIGEAVVIGRDCTIGAGAAIGAGSRVRGQSVVGPSAVLGAGIVCELEVTIGEGAMLADGLFFAQTAFIPAFAVVEESHFQCHLDGEMFVGTASGCEEAGGWVFGDIPLESKVAVNAPVGQEVVPIDPGNLPPELTNLVADAKKAGSGDKRGPIVDRKYVATTYDCDDFASDMEIALEAMGYTATFTCYWLRAPNPNHRYYNWLWTPETIWTGGHAVTDVHVGNRIIWIEPQTGNIIDLDFDKDGKVEYDTTSGNDVTDGDHRIEVYDSRAAAEAAGNVLD